MANMAKRVLKVLAGTSAAAVFYLAGRQLGVQEAAGFDKDETLAHASAKGFARPSDVPPSGSAAYRAALASRSNALRGRIFEKAFEEGSIEQRFDRLMQSSPAMAQPLALSDADGVPALPETVAQPPAQQAEQALAPADASGTEPQADQAPTADAVAQPEPQAAAEQDAQAPQEQDGDAPATTNTGDLDPYHRIQKALSSSDFFDEEGGAQAGPHEFNMP